MGFDRILPKSFVFCLLLTLIVTSTSTAQDVPFGDSQQGDVSIPASELTLRRIAESSVLNILKDPDSAKFRWSDAPAFAHVESYRPNGWLGTTWRDVEIGCGLVNARNSYGGYTGFEMFRVVIKDGTALDVNIDANAGPRTRCF